MDLAYVLFNSSFMSFVTIVTSVMLIPILNYYFGLTPLPQLKEQLLTRVSNSLACYRQNCAAPSQPGQLILPETLKLLPLYSHCLLRSPAIMPSIDVSLCERECVCVYILYVCVCVCAFTWFDSVM